MTTGKKGRLSLLRSLGALAIATAGCAPPPPAAPYLAAPIPAGMARIWFYRDANPNDLLAEAYLRLNGTIVGVTEPGAAFYRDVLPGSAARVASAVSGPSPVPS